MLNIPLVFNNRTLKILNSGNVDYNRELLINLSGTEHATLLVQELKLQPGGFIEVDLYAEVPEDDYDISFPQIAEAPSFEAHLEDERTTLKKTSDFMGITGRVVQRTGEPGIQTILSPVILVLIVGILIFFFTRNKGKRTSYSEDTPSYDEEPLVTQPVQQQTPIQKQAPQKQLSRDDEVVKKWMENLNKDKPT